MDELLIYCNTRQFLTNKWKDDDFDNSFYLPDSDLKRFGVSRVQLEELPQIITVGLNKYNIRGVDSIDLSLVKHHGQPLTDLHKWMLERICETELPEGIDGSPYWKCFLKHRSDYSTLFFTVDEFAGRVHSPISGMRKELRPLILLRNEETTSLDVCQMQPTLLGNILMEHVGENSFSRAILKGVNVYCMLQSKLQLKSRNKAKKVFFKVLFGYPSRNLSELFDGENWIQWINEYKTRNEPRNPHQYKPLSNLAWLLQNFEVHII